MILSTHVWVIFLCVIEGMYDSMAEKKKWFYEK